MKRRKSSNLTTTSEVLQTLHTKAPRRSKVLALSTNNRLLSMWDALGLPFLKFSSSYRLISMLFIEKSRLKSKHLNRSCVGKFWAKLFKKPTKCRNGALSQSGASTVCRSANQNRVILPSIEGKLRKNALCLNQSAFSNFALYVITTDILQLAFANCYHRELFRSKFCARKGSHNKNKNLKFAISCAIRLCNMI